MSNRLPALLQRVDFEPITVMGAHVESADTKFEDEDYNDRSGFKLRVDQLACKYLSGQQLLVLSATLKGPFRDDWSNPWLDGADQQKNARAQTPEEYGIAMPDAEKKADNENAGCLTTYPTNTSPSRHLRPRPISFVSMNELTRQSLIPVDKEDIEVVQDCHGRYVQKMFYSETAPSENVPPNKPQTINERVVDRAMRDFPDAVIRACAECGTRSTGRWMKGPGGPATLCSACGSRFYRKAKKEKASKALEAAANTMVPLDALIQDQNDQTSAAVEDRENEQTPHHQLTEMPIIPQISNGYVYGPRALSQPEFPTRSLFPVDGLFTRLPASSFSGASTGSNSRHFDIMESVFPGGPLVDAYRRYGQLIDLLDYEAPARLSELMILPETVSGSQKARPTKALTKRSPNRKIRAMTFDTPVISRPLKTSKSPVIPKLKDTEGIPGISVDFSRRRSTRRLSDNIDVPQENRNSPSIKLTQDSPYISTQAALLQAYGAFQDGLESPVKPIVADAASLRPVLQDKTNTSAINTPLRKFSEMSKRVLPAASTRTNEPANTQALFNEFTFFGSSPSLESIKTDKKKSKRASFAPEFGAHHIGDSESSTRDESTSLPCRDESSRLRKSALKKSGHQARVSSLSSSSDRPRDRSSGHALTVHALRSQLEDDDLDSVGGDGDGDANDMEVESFLRDANSLLDSSSTA